MNKKHIGGWVLFFAGSICLYAESITVETSTKEDQGNYYGFTLALGTGSPSLTDPSGMLESLSGTTVALDNVDLLTRNNNSFPDAKLAVYSFSEDGNVGDFVGLSDTVVFSPNTNVEFQFTGINLTVGQRYQFLFVNNNASTENLTDLFEASTLLAVYQDYALPWGISVTADQYSGSPLPNGWGTYKSSGLNSWEGHRMPVLALTVSTAEIPEPSSFAFLAGLGALILVVARRRRRPSTPNRK